MKKTKVTINPEGLRVASELMRALAHPLRLRILEFIDTNDRINVNKIYNTLKIEQSITSQHLRILRLAGVVDVAKEGKFMHYSINYDIVKRAEIGLNNFLAREKVS